MKKLYKKIVSLVMSALLAVMVLPVTTHASNQQDNDIVYGADIGWLSQMENQGMYWSSFLVTLCSEIMLYIETPLVSYSYSLNEVSHSCTS